MVRYRVRIALVSAVLAGFATAGTGTAFSAPAQPRVLLDTTYVPPTGGLIRVHSGEDLQAAQFAKDYGSLSDKRFLSELEKVRARVRALPVYRPKKEKRN